jgi:diguanylate cyclase (GGDEF)-like protein
MATARLLTLRLPVALGLVAAAVAADRWVHADAVQLAAGTSAGLICLATARTRSGTPRRWRLFLGIGLIGWALVRLWWLIGEAPATDVGSLVLPACVLAALLSGATALPRPIPVVSRRDRSVLLIDSVLISGSLLALLWAVLPSRVFREFEANPVPVGVAVAYPVAYLVLLTMVLLLLATRPSAPTARIPLRLIGFALAAFGISDVFRLVQVTGGELGPAQSAGYLLGPALIALAALNPSAGPDEPVVARADADWLHLLLPYVPVVATGLVIAIRTSAGGRLTPFEAYLGWLGLGLVVARQMFTIVDNAVLLARVSEGRQRLHHQAFHDPLTGLANRALFRDRLVPALEAHRAGRPLALLFADLDDFKLINDSFGHAMGDRVLRAVGERLLNCVPREDLVCRLGGDEFAVLLEHRAAEAEEIAERMLAVMREPFQIDGHSIGVGASIGLVVPEAGDPALGADIAAAADTLLRRADAAMYAGKRRGKGTIGRHTGGGSEADLPYLLARALTAGPAGAGFEVYYQPVVRLADGATVAVEALARWTDPVAGPVDPDVFVSVAERTGLVTAIDDFVLDRACADATALAQEYGGPIDVHVNVSAARLGQRGFTEGIMRALDRHAVRPSRLVVEITETRRIPDLARAAAAVDRLRGHGIRVALDDFGSGFNALAQLHSLPVDIVKLDATLTDVDVAPERAGALCRSVLSICAEMNVVVIAEGIETPARAQAMAGLGCRLGQGYLFGAPMPLHRLPRRARHLAS